MLPNLFSDPIFLIQGLITGLILGFLLQKGKLSQFSTIIGQLLLKDFTVLKVLLTAIIVGAIGFHGMVSIGLPIEFTFETSSMLAVVIGGIIFGVGMAVLGYCPGTCVVAAGQGSRDGLWGMLGMLFGAFLFAESYELIETEILAKAKMESIKLMDLLHLSKWSIIIALIVISLILFWILRKPKVIIEETKPETR